MVRRRRVVVAPDKFRGTLSAVDAARHIAAGIRGQAPAVEVHAVPVADGGEGTVDAAVAAGHTRVPLVATGPTGMPVDAAIAVRGDTAVVETAQASGLSLLPGGRPQPLLCTSVGVGEMVARALDVGCRRIVLGLGGSACTDGGAGMLTALGVRLLDAEGRPLPPGGAALRRLARIDPGSLARRLGDVEVVVASDVDNPLYGPHGAAVVYAPQKGATAGQVAVLDAGLRHWAEVAAAQVPGCAGAAAVPGSGAAGGIGFAAVGFLGARVRPGIDLLLELLGFDRLACGADLVVTGEGSLDGQTLRGKAPAGVAAAARRHGVPVAVVCGRNELSAAQLAATGVAAVYPLVDLAGRAGDSERRAAELAELAGRRLAADLLTPPG